MVVIGSHFIGKWDIENSSEITDYGSCAKVEQKGGGDDLASVPLPPGWWQHLGVILHPSLHQQAIRTLATHLMAYLIVIALIPARCQKGKNIKHPLIWMSHVNSVLGSPAAHLWTNRFEWPAASPKTWWINYCSLQNSFTRWPLK